MENNLPVSTELKNEDGVIDEIAGIMYKNKTDEADDGCWIEGKDFHKVAAIIYKALTKEENKGNDYENTY